MVRPRKNQVIMWKNGRLGEKQLTMEEFQEDQPTPKKQYKQVWSAYNLAQTNEFKLFQDILIELIDSLIEVRKPIRKNGRPFLDLKEMLFCCVMKTYFGKSVRRNVGYLQIAKELDYIKKVPHFTTIQNYYNNPLLTGLLKHLIEQSGIPLKDLEFSFATDSSGFSTSLFSRWFNIRIGKYSEKRLFKKAHVTSGTKTNIITAVNITEGYCADSPEFKALIKTTAKNYNVGEVSADAGYLARDNFDAVHEIGAIPFIMFKKNSTRKAKGSAIYKRMFDIFTNNHQFFLDKYHKRSNAESLFNMMKRKLGMTLYCRNETGQINELLCKCLAHNICVLIQELFEANISLDYEENEKLIVRGYSSNH